MAVIYSQNGPANIHIKESFGGSYDPLNHYCTSYNLKYGKNWIGSDLYKENKPQADSFWNKKCNVGYNCDNSFLKPNFMNHQSVTKKDFQNPKLQGIANKIDHINDLIIPPGYSFHTELTIPKSMHNPHYWSTVYSTEYNEKIQTPIDFHRDPIGKSECSGFTLNSPIINTLSFLPHSTYKNDWPRKETNRPTEKTVYSIEYKPYLIPNGNESLPEITHRSDRSSGFVKGNQQRCDFVPQAQESNNLTIHSPKELKALKNTDPIEYLNVIHPYSGPSVTHGTFTDPQTISPTEEEILNRVNVGDKERTGFVANQINYIQTADNPKRFITHNMRTYFDRSIIGLKRKDHLNFNVNNMIPDGFVKNNGVQKSEYNVDQSNECLEMDNYQYRSFNKRDYVDK